MGLDILENEGISEKECVEIEYWGFLYSLVSRKFNLLFTLCTYVVANILQNGAKISYSKADLKKYRNLNNFRQAVESPKS